MYKNNAKTWIYTRIAIEKQSKLREIAAHTKFDILSPSTLLSR